MDALKRLRKAKEMTQETLATKLNVDTSTVAKWETGKSFPRGELIPKIAEILECTIDDIFFQPDSSIVTNSEDQQTG